ncbi:cupredoxin domain-containing protein [Dyella mobilis]|uniref:Cupredoxin family copper-binding protein n=1 Tax=Dyella mobilis TaxID=1849582 RepID=A0ABS2KLH5_9GAMM|nr:cupredoxin family copper-binding protein [Dyella mobilis]MBM7132002.1 cupredoxin family copper-binding protein [Dyella mobilis]GLQ96014.1 amicyanin [Dyella mobilis]
MSTVIKALAFAFALTVLLCAVEASAMTAKASSSNGARTYQVAIRNFAFEPGTITVPAGATVVWVNQDEEPHTVTSAGSGFASSKALDTDDRYEAIFSRPGTYTYYCSIHPHMVGTIIVQ